MQFLLCILLVFLLASCGGDSGSSGSIGGNQLPEVDFQVETTRPIIRGENSKNIVAFSGGGDVTVDLSVNSPYSLRDNQLVFTDAPLGVSSERGVTVLNNTSTIREETIGVTRE